MENINRKIIWKFTNGKELTKKEFIDYFERKVFRTIRKFNMLPSNRIIRLKDKKDLNTKVLKNVLEKKFPVKFANKGQVFLSENMSDFSEKIFKNILKGKFSKTRKVKKIKSPLFFLSDAETELYAKLCAIKAKKAKRDKKIQELFNRFIEKNPDLEHNIINAFLQIS